MFNEGNGNGINIDGDRNRKTGVGSNERDRNGRINFPTKDLCRIDGDDRYIVLLMYGNNLLRNTGSLHTAEAV